jgi:hypothetical protein
MTSTFAPPTGPPATTSTVVTPMDVEPVDASTSPNGRRRPFALAAAVVAVLALGVGAFVALTGSNDSADVAEPYSLIAAAESTIEARTVEFELSVSAGDLAAVTVSGAVDNQQEIVSVTTDLSSLLALGDMPLPLGDSEMTALLDAADGVVYLDAGMLGGFLSQGASWVSIDLGVLAEQSGESLDDLQSEFALDPSDIARTLLDTDGATEVGTETIDGVETKRYEVSVDVAAALAAVPQSEIDPNLADVELPDTLVYDVWITADNQLRRVAFDTDVMGQSIAMQLDMTTSSDSLGLEIPADADVFDLTGLLGF